MNTEKKHIRYSSHAQTARHMDTGQRMNNRIDRAAAAVAMATTNNGSSPNWLYDFQK